MHDMYSKGRGKIEEKTVRGEQNGRSKLNWQQVREIRQRYAEGGVSQRELGRQYKIDNKVINKIIHNKIWIE
jgi:hypothetical protein